MPDRRMAAAFLGRFDQRDVVEEAHLVLRHQLGGQRPELPHHRVDVGNVLPQIPCDDQALGELVNRVSVVSGSQLVEDAETVVITSPESAELPEVVTGLAPVPASTGLTSCGR